MALKWRTCLSLTLRTRVHVESVLLLPRPAVDLDTNYVLIVWKQLRKVSECRVVQQIRQIPLGSVVVWTSVLFVHVPSGKNKELPLATY
jgi:hypothetical protein